MLISNFAMVAVAYHIFNGGNKENDNTGKQLYLTERFAWLGFSITTLICLVSGGISFYYVPHSHHNTFYKQLTFKQHIATYYWHEKTWNTVLDREVDSQEAVRALLPMSFSLHYLPKVKLIKLYKNRWADWIADPPDWFDADFRAMIPRQLLVEVPPSLWEETGNGG